MEKQIQTLTSELNHLKNNQNNVTTFVTKKSFTTTNPNNTLTAKYAITSQTTNTSKK